MRQSRADGLHGSWSPTLGGQRGLRGADHSGAGGEHRLAGRHLDSPAALSHPGDAAETQAERVSMAVLSGGSSPAVELGAPREPSAAVQRQASGSSAMASAMGGALTAGVSGGGQPLPEATRTFFEGRLGHDFGSVRVHSGPAAEGAAKAVAARAFTRGEDVVFGAGHWRPNTAAGQILLAHELTHVVQQRRDGGSPETIQRAPDPETWVPDSDGSLYYATEAEAERRRAALAAKGEWSEYRVVSFKQGSTTYWRVEMRGEKKGAAPAPGPPAPSAPKEESPKQPAPPPAPAPSPSAPGPTTPAPTTPAPTTPATGATRVFSLTFDDGPHAAALGTGKNRTEKVLDTLKSKGVKGAFFVQTGVSYRGASSVGKKLMARMAAEGHTVGIHTGGTADHELHTKAEAAGRLESELKAGKAAIAAETGSTPTLVRPPTGASNKAVEATYAKVSLSNLLWDIDGDVGASSLADLKARLDSTDPKAPGIPAVHARGWTGTTPSKPKIVVLYHDVRANTASNIGPVIDHIKAVTAKISGGKDTADFAPP